MPMALPSPTGAQVQHFSPFFVLGIAGLGQGSCGLFQLQPKIHDQLPHNALDVGRVCTLAGPEQLCLVASKPKPGPSQKLRLKPLQRATTHLRRAVGGVARLCHTSAGTLLLTGPASQAAMAQNARTSISWPRALRAIACHKRLLCPFHVRITGPRMSATVKALAGLRCQLVGNNPDMLSRARGAHAGLRCANAHLRQRTPNPLEAGGIP